MGFLGEGNTLTWEEVEKIVPYIKEHGILQFLEIMSVMKDDGKRPHLWGDEVEFTVMHLNHQEKKVELHLKTIDILNQLNAEVEKDPNSPIAWRPEYGVFMIEAVPGFPYEADDLNSLTTVEKNMELRRLAIEAKINKAEGDLVLSVSHFPLLGCPDSLYPYNTVPTIDACNSKFSCDEVINPHFRFGTLTKNIRVRKGRNVSINMPLFIDSNTPTLTHDHLFAEGEEVQGKENHVYADSMAFGMGQSCLQVTFQAVDLEDCLHIYDQLLPLTPLMLALSASTPILRGYLMDYDVRWEIISQAVDDRTDEELGKVPLNKNSKVIGKSRYASVSSFLGSKGFKSEYNDIDHPEDEKSLKTLLDAGIPELISHHVAHLFIRDPLVVYKDRIEVDDKLNSDHFENIQSTNWQSLRFKPPPAPAGQKIGWRVEFRTMELQFTDFENSAFACFICLMTQVIRTLLPNFYMPISKIDDNMKRAHARDAVNSQKFWFRKDISTDSTEDEFVEMTLGEILNGSENFAGVIPLVRKYLESREADMEEATKVQLSKYLDFIGARADGSLETNASWIRRFVRSHPEYKKDSVVTHPIVYDLFTTIDKIQKHEIKDETLYGNFY